MKRHEFEQEFLQMILDGNSDDFVEQMNDADVRANLKNIFNEWAKHRNTPMLSASMSAVIAGIISYEAKYQTETEEDLMRYKQDMKAHQWENRNDF